MLLVIDVGNTNIVGGLYEGEALVDSFRLRSVCDKTEDEYRVMFRGILADRDVPRAIAGTIDRVLISSVVPSLTESMIRMARALFRVEPVVLAPALYPLLPVKVIAPDEIDTDLVANAVAAYVRSRNAAIIVDFGTALTFTAVAADGRIAGVAIAPGLKTAVASLVRETAQLPDVPLVAPGTVLGENTVHAIQAGIVLGYSGLVESLVGRMKAELGGTVRVLATGGLCRVVAPNVASFDDILPNLTLDGLAAIADIVHDASAKIPKM